MEAMEEKEAEVTVAANERWEIESLDVTSAVLQGSLLERDV